MLQMVLISRLMDSKDGLDHFPRARFRVEGLRGEFYWKIAIGDRVSVSDFVNVPFLLTEEQSSEELHYSVGCYFPKNEVEQAFRLKDPLPSPEGIAPHQPNPYRRQGKHAFPVVAFG